MSQKCIKMSRHWIDGESNLVNYEIEYWTPARVGPTGKLEQANKKIGEIMIRRTKVMKRSIKGFFTAIAIAGLWVGASMNASANIDWFFGPGGAFTGTGPNSSDWLQAELSQAGANSVSVTLTWLNVPTGTKLVANGGDNGGFYMNYIGNPSALTFTMPSGLTPTTGEDAFKADGDGLYDILIGTDSAFTAGTVNTISFTINGTGITPASFDTSSTGAPGNGTTWLAAAHIGGYGNSVWTGAITSSGTPQVPEPATVLAGLLLLLPFGASAARVIRSRK
jgi:hypothetical protein